MPRFPNRPALALLAALLCLAACAPTATVNVSPRAMATTRPTATTRPVVAATATATPAPPPVNFTVTPLTFTYSTCANSPDAPAVTLTLDNTKSTVAVRWQATVVENDGAGVAWAYTVNPLNGGPLTSGMIGAPGTQQISVTPAYANLGELCRSSPPPNGKVWHVSSATANAGTFTFAYSVS